VYAAWGVEFDPGNFRRKFVMGKTEERTLIRETGERTKPRPGSPGGKPAAKFRLWSFRRLHPPLDLSLGVREEVPFKQQHLSDDPDLYRTHVWRCWIGGDDDAAFQRMLIEKGWIAPRARGDEKIDDQEWHAFLAGMQVGDFVLAPLPGDKVLIGEILSGIFDRPKARDQRLRQVREIDWRAKILRDQLPEDFRERLDLAGSVTPIRITAAARRVRKLLENSQVTTVT
jgi:hypothetical protein